MTITLQQFSRLGAKARWAGMTPEERKAATLKATEARKKQAKKAREEQGKK